MKRTSFERFLVASVVVLSAVLSLALYRGRTNANNGQRLMAELSMLRGGVTLYRTFNHQYPRQLAVLIQETYAFDGQERRPFVDQLAPNDQGEFVDPFGSPYHYDAASGWVKSTTEGYDQW